ncbi:MAG: hypothetical protein KC516_03015 [Nanoarchaeota archaeon]|nr:hypothetical protein [Nanoarchaeota archaeon]
MTEDGRSYLKRALEKVVKGDIIKYDSLESPLYLLVNRVENGSLKGLIMSPEGDFDKISIDKLLESEHLEIIKPKKSQ